MTILFAGDEFRRLTASYVSGVADSELADGAREAAREIYRSQKILRRVFSQTEAGQGRVFEAAHPGCDFGALVGFFMPNADGSNTPPTSAANVGTPIYPNSGEPTIEILATSAGQQATRIYCDFFGNFGRGAGWKAVAVAALVLDDTATGIPANVFRELRNLFQAAILKEFGGFLTEGKPNLEYWRMEYARHSNAAMERLSPGVHDAIPSAGFVGPPGGGEPSAGFWGRW